MPGRRWTTERSQELRDGDILEHLVGTRWIGCRLPNGRPLDRVVIDIDCKGPSDVAWRDERYWRVRGAFGRERIPLVYATPTGEGIRVAYRIQDTPYEDIRPRHGRGPMHGFLEHHGLEMRNGVIEVFPAHSHLDRQMFGASMPFLCPDTLSPLIGARGRPFRAGDGELETAVEHCEQWFLREDPGLPAMIGGFAVKTPPSRRGSVSVQGPRAEPFHRRGTARQTRTGEGHILPLVVGLESPSTRHEVEFLVGAALWRWSDQFSDLARGQQPSRETVALALARWLSQNHNGMSKEWLQSVDEHGARKAVWRWRERYLTPGPDGDAPIDRMARLARTLGRKAPVTPQLTESEHRSVQLLSLYLASEFSGTMDRYQWEIWTSHFVAAVRRQVMRGGKSGDDRLSAAQLAAEWMSEWPYGRHYRRYLGLLTRESSGGSGRPEAVQVLWRPEGRGKGIAAIYRVPWLDLGDRRLPQPRPEKVRKGIEGITHQGRPVTLEEAYHAIHRTTRGPDLNRTFGISTANRIRRIAAAARNGGRISF